MARYDTRLLRERGEVRASQSPNYNDYRARYGYDREYDRRHATYWRRPNQLRGETRGGSAFSYGVGGDADRIDRGMNRFGPGGGMRGGWGRAGGGEWRRSRGGPADRYGGGRYDGGYRRRGYDRRW